MTSEVSSSEDEEGMKEEEWGVFATVSEQEFTQRQEKAEDTNPLPSDSSVLSVTSGFRHISVQNFSWTSED